jgi:outer membrane protein OmpA-like peptidoglycan-associated protein
MVGLGLVMPALLLVAPGCATKSWVKEVVGKTSTEFDERVGRVESRVGETDQRLDKESQRVGAVEGRVAEGAQRIEGMGFRMTTFEASLAETRERTEAAHGKADEVNARLTRLWSTRHARNLVDTAHVKFAFGRADLDDAAQTALHALVKELRENPRLTVDLEGYADPTGKRDYNVALSQRRVEAVRRYLVENGVELTRINSIGLGSIMDPKQPAVQKRRVTVKTMVAQD